MAQPDDGDEAPDQATYKAAPSSRPPLPTPPPLMQLSMNTIPSRMSGTTRNDQDEAPDQATYMAAPSSQPPQSPRNTIPLRMSSTTRNDQDLQDENIVPKVGMSFQSEEKAYAFYNFYAQNKGFNIRKCHLKYRADGSLSSRYLVCSKSGVKATHPTHVVKKEQAISRTDCMAHVQFLFLVIYTQNENKKRYKPSSKGVGVCSINNCPFRICLCRYCISPRSHAIWRVSIRFCSTDSRRIYKIIA